MTEEAFWRNIKVTDNGCWEWQGSRDGYGYGFARVGGVKRRTHQLAFLLTYGYLPGKGRDIHHQCDNPPCMNPAHLRDATHRDNLMFDAMSATTINAKKTHCPKGHLLAGDNLVPYHTKLGWRTCRICKNESARNWYRRKVSMPV